MLPLNCMINIQNKIKNVLKPYASNEICTHVITDKQWPQENILCLLSNAVKYSSGGEVAISMTLRSRNDYGGAEKVPAKVLDEGDFIKDVSLKTLQDNLQFEAAAMPRR